MSVRTVPETGGRADWPRLVAQGVNGLRKALEAYTSPTFIFTPSATPASPVEGMTYMDSTTHKLRTYDGTIWRDHW